MFRYYFFRQLPFVLVVLLIAGGIGYYILNEDNRQREAIYQLQVTVAVETAVAEALYDATRTAEAPLPHYRLIAVPANTPLVDVAVQYRTSIEAIRMANRLLPNVDFGNGSTIIIPENVEHLIPARAFSTVQALTGETLEILAKRYGVALALLIQDNPILAQRGVIPGDVVFIPELL